MNQIKDTIEIDLGEVFTVLLSHIWLILIAGFLSATAGFAISKFMIAPTYESTTKIYILNKQDSSTLTYSDVQMGTQLTKDYSELITSRYVLESVADRLGLKLTYNEMLPKISVTSPKDTRIVAITVEDHDPELAMNIADVVREVASEHIQNVMDIDAVNVVETANMPTQKAKPSVREWTVIGGLIGVLLMSVIVVLRYLLDDTIKCAEDVQKYLNLSTLALIPLSEEEADHGKKRRKR